MVSSSPFQCDLSFSASVLHALQHCQTHLHQHPTKEHLRLILCLIPVSFSPGGSRFCLCLLCCFGSLFLFFYFSLTCDLAYLPPQEIHLALWSPWQGRVMATGNRVVSVLPSMGGGASASCQWKCTSEKSGQETMTRHKGEGECEAPGLMPRTRFEKPQVPSILTRVTCPIEVAAWQPHSSPKRCLQHGSF